MTTNNGAGGLVAKWREESKLLEKSFAPSSTIIAVERRWCARELEAALQAQADAVPCKTVIVYGDHGPEEREPVEDYYTAPPSDVLRRVVEAAEGLRQRQREYLADAAGHRDNAKGALVGVAADHLDAVLAAAHKALAEGVGRDR